MEDDDRRIRALEGKIALLKGQPIHNRVKADINWYDEQELKRCLVIQRPIYCNLVNKQTTAVGNLAKTHGVPLGGEVVDIQEVLVWFHGYISKWGRTCNGRGDGPDEQKEDLARRKEALDLQTLEIKFKLLEADFQKKAGNAIAADEVDRLFAWFEGELRKLGERLGKRFGADAQELFNNTLDRIGRHLEELMPREEGIGVDVNADASTTPG